VSGQPVLPGFRDRELAQAHLDPLFQRAQVLVPSNLNDKRITKKIVLDRNLQVGVHPSKMTCRAAYQTSTFIQTRLRVDQHLCTNQQLASTEVETTFMHKGQSEPRMHVAEHARS